MGSKDDDLTAHLCAATSGVLSERKLEEAAVELCHRFARCLVQMPAAEHCLMLAVSDVTRVLRRSFGRYLPQLVPRLVDGIGHCVDDTLRQLSVGAAADIYRAVDAADALQHLDRLMAVLIDLTVKDDDSNCEDDLMGAGDSPVDLETRVQLAGCFSDVCLAVGPQFRPYVRPVVDWLRRTALRLITYYVRFD